MKVTELRGQTVVGERVPAEMTAGEELYQITFVDKTYGDVIFLRFGPDVRDQLVSQLQGSGLVVARDVPKVVSH